MTSEPAAGQVLERNTPGDSQDRELPARYPPARDLPAGGSKRQRDEERQPFRWDLALVWFMRVAAILWIAKGLAYWVVLLGFLPQTPVFETQTLQWQSAIVYFAVIDLVAAVGLWLTSTWGGVIWLLAALSYLLIGFFVPHAVVSGPVAPGILGFLVVTYFVLSWRASRIAP
ncbi:DUF6163 family protein [Pseudochelatococcus lubricantis]|uniref:DUF6163 family protein n=1 Tax=Pseudochelatococcus lubricantis TaxID=1538102 RepID=UPI0035E9F37B